MTGPGMFASDEGFAERARRTLDEVAASVRGMEAAQREVVAKLVDLWPFEGWKAAGARSPKDWLVAYTGQSVNEARRLAQIAELCTRHSVLGGAIMDGTVPMGWAERLSRFVTTDRAPYLTDDVVDAFLGLVASGASDDQFMDVVRFWADKADQELKPRRVQRQSLVATQRLFGGGEVHANLSPGAFQNVLSAVGAFTQDPDPGDGPYQRTYSERRADALDDLAHFGLTHGAEDGCLRGSGGSGAGSGSDDVMPDGFDDRDILDDLLDDDGDDGPGDGSGFGSGTEDPAGSATSDDGNPASGAGGAEGRPPSEGGDPGAYMDALRATIRRRVECQDRRARRQLKPRSGARIDVTIDIATFLGLRDIDDFDGLVRHSREGWSLTRDTIELLTCDSSLVATLFRGRRILDANASAEQFSSRQRRAIATRDRHCVFPSCRRPPQHCDAHHIIERDNHGPTIVENGCLLCRHHHRLIHLYDWTISHDDDWHWTATDTHGQTWTERRPSHPGAA